MKILVCDICSTKTDPDSVMGNVRTFYYNSALFTGEGTSNSITSYSRPQYKEFLKAANI